MDDNDWVESFLGIVGGIFLLLAEVILTLGVVGVGVCTDADVNEGERSGFGVKSCIAFRDGLFGVVNRSKFEGSSFSIPMFSILSATKSTSDLFIGIDTSADVGKYDSEDAKLNWESACELSESFDAVFDFTIGSGVDVDVDVDVSLAVSVGGLVRCVFRGRGTTGGSPSWHFGFTGEVGVDFDVGVTSSLDLWWTIFDSNTS